MHKRLPFFWNIKFLFCTISGIVALQMWPLSLHGCKFWKGSLAIFFLVYLRNSMLICERVNCIFSMIDLMCRQSKSEWWQWVRIREERREKRNRIIIASVPDANRNVFGIRCRIGRYFKIDCRRLRIAPREIVKLGNFTDGKNSRKNAKWKGRCSDQNGEKFSK